VLLLLMLVSQWRAMDRERDLLTNGEVAAARITQKVASRNASAIKYEFEDFSGRRHSNTGTDYTQKLEEGMSVPVFYDRENPNRQVPACGTFHEVIEEKATKEPG
jgi:RNA 3'-terminal phosphate cyclase